MGGRGGMGQRLEDRDVSISRRVFVKSGGLALFSVGLDPLFLARAVFTSYKPLPPMPAALSWFASSNAAPSTGST